MKQKNKPRRKPWWLALLPLVLGILFIFFSYWWWSRMSGGPGGGSGAGSGGGEGSGTGSGIGIRQGGGAEDGSGKGLAAQPKKETPAAPQKSGEAGKAEKKAPPLPPARRPSEPPAPPKQRTDVSVEASAPLLAPGVGFQKRGSPSDSGRGGGGGSGKFYGIELNKEENVLFLVDVSGSMGSNTAENRSRLEVLKKELLRAIRPRSDEEGERGKYFIVPYSDDAVIIPRSQRPFRFHRAEDQRAAAAEIDVLHCQGGTQMGTAWRKILPVLKHYRISCVYFLTDGEPTDAFTADQFADLRNDVGNTFRVECIAVGRDSDLLKAIAARSRGRYLVVH